MEQKTEQTLLGLLLGGGIGICIIAAYLMFKGWIETGVVILVIGIIMLGINATIRRKKKEKMIFKSKNNLGV